MNVYIYVFVLTLFSIDNAYDSPPRYILFPFNFTCLFYLFVDGLMYIRVIMRDNSLYILVNQLIVTVSIT